MFFLVTKLIIIELSDGMQNNAKCRKRINYRRIGIRYAGNELVTYFLHSSALICFFGLWQYIAKQSVTNADSANSLHSA